MPTNQNLSLLTLCDEFQSFLYRLLAFNHVLRSLYSQGVCEDEAAGFSLLFDDLVESFSDGFKRLEALSKGGETA